MKRADMTDAHRVMAGVRIVAGLAVAVAALGLQSLAVHAQQYPTQPIRITVPYGAGSATDIVMRRLEPHMSRHLGQQIVIENRPGATGSIGADVVRRSKPDGYTLLFTAAAHSTQAALRPKSLPFDPIRDFSFIGRAYSTSGLVAVHPSMPIRNLKELFALSKSVSTGFNYAVGGIGSSHHLQGEALKARGANLVAISYPNVAQGINDVIAGHVPIIVYATAALTPHIKNGKLRAIAVNSDKRSPELPDVPTILEQGYKGTGRGGWSGLMGPAGLSQAIRQRVYAALTVAVNDPQVMKAAAAAGMEEALMPPNEFQKFVEEDIAMWKEVVAKAGLATDSNK